MVAKVVKSRSATQHLHAREQPIMLEWEVLDAAPPRRFERETDEPIRALWNAAEDEF